MRLSAHLLTACSLALLPLTPALAGEGKLQETAGVTQIEGSAGGGLVPWAVLAGYDSREEMSASVFTTRVSVDDYRLNAFGAAISLYDRVELSIARHTFDLLDTPFEINQNVIGAKARLYGDVIYSSWPQVSLGVQHKVLLDTTLAEALGATDSDDGTDIYLAASKAHLGALFGYNLFWDLTLRATKANQFGLLGFGGDNNDSYQIMAEGSVAVLLSRQLALGLEYRQKPDNLPGLEEEDAMDVFVAYIPNKQFNLTAAWVDLGTIAGAENQRGPYLSLTGYLW
ncbi:MAG: DUF3034 family protein [Gammaproteobacteria bacterium]